MRGNTNMNLPEIEGFKSINASVSDLEEEVNQLQRQKRLLALKRNSIQEQINLRIELIDKRKLQEENNK